MSYRVIAAEPPPSAGSQMQQIHPIPIPQKTTPAIEIEQITAPVTPEPGGQKILVKGLRVTGAKAYSEAVLLAVTGFKPGSELTLADLRTMASRIADYYHENGYFVAQAYLPAQDIKDGVVTIAVIDGLYGKVTLHNETNISDKLADSILAGLNSGDLVESSPLENRLLLLSDLPGVNVRSTLVPGESEGTSDLIVNVTPGEYVTGSIDADNAGNRYTGEYRIGATVNLNEPTGNGDVATLRALTSGPGLNYARASYQTQLAGGQVGVAYSALRYALGREFGGLGANGTEEIASIYGIYPLIRSRKTNLNFALDFDSRTFQDNVESTSTVTNKKASVVMASLYGDHRDNLGSGGMNSYSLTGVVGNLDIQTPLAQFLDASTAQSNGNYHKLVFSAMRLQNVTETISLSALINGQIAAKNLDISEKMELGGMYAVRAYPEGEAFADEGYVLHLEVRKQLPKFSDKLPGQIQLIGFFDSGTVTLNKNPWADGQNSRTLRGAGVGLDWTGPSNFMVNAYYAHKLGDAMATSAPDSSGRFWIQVVKYF